MILSCSYNFLKIHLEFPLLSFYQLVIWYLQCIYQEVHNFFLLRFYHLTLLTISSVLTNPLSVVLN